MFFISKKTKSVAIQLQLQPASEFKYTSTFTNNGRSRERLEVVGGLDLRGFIVAICGERVDIPGFDKFNNH